MKENIMRDKIISLVLGLLLWVGIMYFYWLYTWKWSMIFPNQKSVNWITTRWGNFDTSIMSDDQLQKMADRAWITLAELKNKLDAGENIRDILPARSWSWTRSGSTFQWNRTQDSISSTWSN
jgi:hypothetical protein